MGHFRERFLDDASGIENKNILKNNLELVKVIALIRKKKKLPGGKSS